MGLVAVKAALRAYFENNSLYQYRKVYGTLPGWTEEGGQEVRNTDWLMPKKVIVEKEREYYIKIDTYQLYEIQDLIVVPRELLCFRGDFHLAGGTGHDYPRWLLPGG